MHARAEEQRSFCTLVLYSIVPESLNHQNRKNAEEGVLGHDVVALSGLLAVGDEFHHPLAQPGLREVNRANPKVAGLARC